MSKSLKRRQLQAPAPPAARLGHDPVHPTGSMKNCTYPYPEADGSAVAREIRQAPAFEDILYSQSWEDPDVDRRALGIAAADDVFTIAASGDNALAFLLDEPRSLTALDFNRSQCHVLELKMAALEKLTHGELLEFVGAARSNRRGRCYRRVRDALSEPAADFWDRRPELIDRGVIHVGRFERYFKMFRRYVLPMVHSRATCDRLLACRTLAEQRSFYRDHWNGIRWQLLLRSFFNRTVMARFGRDPATFRYVVQDVASAVGERTRRGLTEVPVRSNWFLEYILRGRYGNPERRPAYLIEDNQPKLRRLLSRVTIVSDEITRYLAARRTGFSKYCLSDVFEYMSAEAADRLFGALGRVSPDGAVLSYREMMVPRSRPEKLSRVLVEDETLAARCHRTDRSFFYGAHHVVTVRREVGS